MYLANLYRGWGRPRFIPQRSYLGCEPPTRAKLPRFLPPPNFGERPFLPGMPNSEASGPAPARLAPRLAPSSSPRPSPHPLPPQPHRARSFQGDLRPPALAANSISPRPTASSGKTQGDPQPRVSHHRGCCLGRKAEVRKCPAPRRLPFRERRSRSLDQHFREGPSRAGPGRKGRTTLGSPGRFHTGTSGTGRRR